VATTDPITTETNTAAMDLVQELGQVAINLARINGHQDDPSKSTEDRAVALLKAGIPLALTDPRYMSLIA
jgi:hypothetical protein